MVNSEGGWTFVKFPSAYTTSGAARAYSIWLKQTPGVNTINPFASAGNTWASFVRTTITGVPATGDEFIIAGEYTASGAVTTRTVTMDNITATSYGAAETAANSLNTPAISVSHHGVLNWDTISGNNYALNLSGNIIIYSSGNMSMGTTAIPIADGATSTITFTPATNVDYGLIVRNSGILNIQGSNSRLDRTFLTSDLGGYCTISGAVRLLYVLSGNGMNVATLSGLVNTYNLTSAAGTMTQYSISQSGTQNAQVLTIASGGLPTNLVLGKFTQPGSANVLNVVSTAGWKAGDVLGIADTTSPQTTAAGSFFSESGTISIVNSATQVTLNSGLQHVHQGTVPFQAEVINLTKNVKIKGITQLLGPWIQFGTANGNGAFVDIDHCEFTQLGSATTPKRGIETNCSGYQPYGSRIDIQNCSFHDMFVNGSTPGCFATISTSPADWGSLTFSNNVSYDSRTTGGPQLTLFATTSADSIISGNIFIGPFSNTSSLTLNDFGFGPFINNTMAGCATGLNISEPITNNPGLVSTPGVMFQFSGNVIHSMGGNGILLQSIADSFIGPNTIWRCKDFLSLNAATATSNIIFSGLWIHSCNSSLLGHIITQATSNVIFVGCSSDRDNASALGQHITANASTADHNWKYVQCQFGMKTGAPWTPEPAGNACTLFGAQIASVGTQTFFIDISLINCTSNSNMWWGGPLASFTKNYYIGQHVSGFKWFMDDSRINLHNCTFADASGIYRTHKRNGMIDRVSSPTHTGNDAISMTCFTTSGNVGNGLWNNRLETAPFYAAVASGSTVTPTVYVMTALSGTFDKPRLVQKACYDMCDLTPAFFNDTVLATFNAQSGVWTALTGTTAVAPRDGVFSFVVDCVSGTVVFADSFSVA